MSHISKACPHTSKLAQYHQSVIDNAREAEKAQAGRPLAIALDTKGPEIRTGNTVDNKDYPIKQGDVINITTDEKYATSSDNVNMSVGLFQIRANCRWANGSSPTQVSRL